MWDWVVDLLGEGGTQPLLVSKDTGAAHRPSLLVQGGGGGSSGLWDFLGGGATSSDEEEEEEEEKDEHEDEEERYLSETKKERAAVRVGSTIERWALRYTDSAILSDLAAGCRCGCVHNVLALGEVARARLEQKAFDCTDGAPWRSASLSRHERRAVAIARSASTCTATTRSSRSALPVMYAARSGNRLAWLYEHIADQRKGSGFDDPNLGGNRRSTPSPSPTSRRQMEGSRSPPRSACGGACGRATLAT